MNKARILFSFLITFIIALFLLSGCGKIEKVQDVLIGITWCDDASSEVYTNVADTLDDMNIKYVMLEQVKSDAVPYDGAKVSSEATAKEGYLLQEYADEVKKNQFEKSNVASATEKVDGVIFIGGDDVSPTLYKNPEPWHGIEEEKGYNAARDVNDYILMSYCIEQDIPVFGICRGMQILAVCSGATVIQDIPAWFEEQGILYDNTHRNFKETPDAYCDYASHDVRVTDKDSALYDVVGDTMLYGVPSWHHQNIRSVDGTNLKVTGVTDTCGYEMIEAIQYVGKKYIVGFQFHPETAAAKHIKKVGNASDYMSKEQAEKFFDHFYQSIK